MKQFFLSIDTPPEIQMFFDYFKNTFVCGRTDYSAPLFPPSLWSNFFAYNNLYKTTSNNVEGWHKRVKEILNRNFTCVLFEFIQFLSRENEFVNRSCNEIGHLNKHEANETDKTVLNSIQKLEN